jgi:hypothetical protein
MDNQNLLKDLGLMEAIRKREAVQEVVSLSSYNCLQSALR